MKRVFFLILISIVFVCQAVASEPIGVVANNNTNSFQMINPLTQEISESQLKGYLGSYGGGLFDVVFSKDGKTAIISNFGDSTLYFVDISGGFSGTPSVLGSVAVPFFAEDMDVTPDGKYVLVTDGGFSPRCAVIDIATRTLAKNNYLGAQSAQAVAVTPDGKFVLFADYFGAAIHSFSLNADGTMAFISSVFTGASRPVNISISPDGKTAIAAASNRYDCPVFAIGTDGGLNYKGDCTMTSKGGQSVVFSKDSKKAYYFSNAVNRSARIHILDITAPGVAELEGYVELSIPRGTSQLFGVDTLAVDPSSNYLYVANPTVSGGVVEVAVIDLATKTEVNQLHCNGIPTGIAFTTIQ